MGGQVTKETEFLRLFERKAETRSQRSFQRKISTGFQKAKVAVYQFQKDLDDEWRSKGSMDFLWKAKEQCHRKEFLQGFVQTFFQKHVPYERQDFFARMR